MDKDRLDRQIEFIREIDKEKSIGRQTYLADASRRKMTLSMHGIWQL